MFRWVSKFVTNLFIIRYNLFINKFIDRNTYLVPYVILSALVEQSQNDRERFFREELYYLRLKNLNGVIPILDGIKETLTLLSY